MNPLPGFPVKSIAKTSIADDGASADITFTLPDDTEETVRFPFEVIADIQVSLAHLRSELLQRRKAAGAGESANLLGIQGLSAKDLPGGDLKLHIYTTDNIPFHFHLQRQHARALANALNDLLAKTEGQQQGPKGVH